MTRMPLIDVDRGVARALTRPLEAAQVQASGRAPHAKAVVNQQLHSRGARVGEEVAVMGLCRAEDPHHAGQQSISARAHVNGLHGQPHRVDRSCT